MITHEKTILQQTAVSLVCLVLSIFLLTFNIIKPRVNLLELGVSYLFYPFQQGLALVNRKVGQTSADLQLMQTLRTHNQSLRQQLQKARREISSLEEDRAALQRLQQLFAFSKRHPFEVTVAQVIAIDPSNWSDVIVIDKGKRSGIKENMPVVIHQGLVGQVLKVSPHFSKVLLLKDQRSGVGAMVQRSRAVGVLEGQQSQISQLKYIDPTADLAINDVIISSGLGGVFPKGIELGKVSRIEREKTGVYQKIEVTLAADFSRLEEVMVIKNALLEEVLSLIEEEE